MTNLKPLILRARLAKKLFSGVTNELLSVSNMDNPQSKLNALYNAYKRLLMAKGVFRSESLELVKERLKFKQDILDKIASRPEYGEAEEFLAECIYNEAMEFKQKLAKILYNDKYQTKEKGVTPTNQPQNGPTERS